MNQKFVQIQGPFKKGEEVIDKVKQNFPEFVWVERIGIQVEPDMKNSCRINDEVFEIGKTGILEFGDVEIKSLKFLQDEPKNTLVDLVVR